MAALPWPWRGKKSGDAAPDGPRAHNPRQRHLYGEKGGIAPPSLSRVEAMYRREPFFTNLLPWLDYDPESQAFLLSDGRGLGALFEIQAAGCEARPARWLENFRDKVQIALGALPETDPPWVVQFYVQDEPRLESLIEDIESRWRRPSMCAVDLWNPWRKERRI